jgi:pimeloyl-ACP methyl ester carboxylesterase
MRGVMILLFWAAQAQGKEEKGKYTLSFFGKESGAEEFRLEEFEDGQVVLHAKSRFEIQVRGKPQTVSADTMLTMDKSFAPVRYAGLEKAAGQERRSKIEWKDGAAYPDPRRPVKTSAVFLLDNNVYAQFIPILRRFEGPKKRVKAFSPVTMGDVELLIEDMGEVTMKGKETSARARELQITIGSVALTAHLDGQKRLVRLSSPLVGALAELEGFEGLVPEPRGGEIRRPDPVAEFDVTFPSGSIMLAGSVTMRRGAKSAPAVVLISGLGPQDRNGNVVRGKGEAERFAWGGPDGSLLKAIAYALSEAGVTVLRVDDRGCGRSGGDFAVAMLSDFTSDVEAAVAFLRSRDDTGAVGLVGHGEGAVIAPIVGSRDGTIKAVFLMAGPARPLDRVLLERIGFRMREGGQKEETVLPILDRQKEVFRRIKETKEDWLEIDERRTFVGWLREHFNHDPLAQIRKLKSAIVILQGSLDRQVLPAHAEALAKERPDAELKIFEGLDHLFMKPEGKTGGDAGPDRRVDGEFLKFLADRVSTLLR